MDLKERYKQIFIEKIEIFSDMEFERFQEFAKITHENNESKKIITFLINISPFTQPDTDLIIKLFNFYAGNKGIKYTKNIKIKINLEFLYTEASLYSCLLDFVNIQKLNSEFRNHFEIKNFKFNFPEITLIAFNEKQWNIFNNVIRDIYRFFKFLFGNWEIEIKLEKNFLTTDKSQKTKLLLYLIDKKDFSGNKTYSLGLTDTKNFYFLSIPKEKYLSNTETIENLKEEKWYHCDFELIDREHRQSNNIDGFLNNISETEDPENFLLFDLKKEKISPISIHTKFSAFDGLYKYEDFAKIAKKYNHKRIGVTDFASVQSFSEVEKISKKYGIKPAYGIELEVIPEKNDIVIQAENYQNSKPNKYAFFDIETTGLNPLFDDLIEIAISKYENNVLVEKYQNLIKIDTPIKPKITQLTNITDELLEKEGKDLKQVLIEVIDFIKDCILIAHNGIEFDLPFINAKLSKCNLPKIDNPLIDTLELSRGIFWENNYKSHALSSICKREGIEYNEKEAHRADHDIKVLAEVFFKLIKNLDKFEINIEKSLLDLNEKINNYKTLNTSFGHNVLIYSRNQEGIRDLYEITSISHTTCFYGKPAIKKSILEKFRKNLIFISSPINSDLIHSLFKEEKENFQKLAKFYDFIIIPPISHFKHNINRDEFTEEQLKKGIKLFYEWTKESEKKPIFNYYSKYLHSWQEQQYSVLVHTKAISGKRHFLYSNKDKNDVMPDFSYKTTEQLINEYKFLNISTEELENTIFANLNNFWELIDENIEVIKKKLHSPEIPGCDKEMINKCKEKMKELFGDLEHEFLMNRFNKELKAIVENKFVVIYWISHLLVKKSLEDGYLVGSRGSVGSSFIAYLLGISEVNPLPPYYVCVDCSYFELQKNFDESGFDLPKAKCPKCQKYLHSDGQNIPFETFLGFEGNKIPDIDLNFSGEYQNIAHNFLREKFGKDNVYRAGTVSAMAKKTAYAVTMNYLEETKLPHNPGKVQWLANQIIDIKRTSGQHPGGILVIPENESVYNFTPVNYPANDLESEWLTTHFQFNDLHDSLLKFDILGHDDPTIIRMLQRLTGINPLNIKYDDKKIIELFSSCETLGLKPKDIMGETVGTIALPEFGTISTRKILQVCKPKTFADLIRISGISHGTNVWKNNIDKLIEKEKYSLKNIISCRDDIMLYLISCGLSRQLAFDVSESIRKGWGVSDEFLSILRKHKIPEWYIKSAQKISYIFPKAHAAAYVLMTWKIAYYKLYYPLEFYASYFYLNSENFDAELIVKNDKEKIIEKYQNIKRRLDSTKYEIKKTVKNKEKASLTIYEVAIEFLSRGFNFQNIDINKSKAFEFEILKENKSLILPFIVIEGLGSIKAKAIEDNRDNCGDYISFEDFEKRSKLNQTIIKKFKQLNVINPESTMENIKNL